MLAFALKVATRCALVFLSLLSLMLVQCSRPENASMRGVGEAQLDNAPSLPPLPPLPPTPTPLLPDDGKPGMGPHSAPVTFKLTVKHSGKCLDRNSQGVAVQQACANTPSQAWNVVGTGNDDFQLISTISGRCLTAEGTALSNGTAVQERDCKPDNSQQHWHAFYVDEESLQIKLAGTEACLDIFQRSQENGTVAILWGCSQTLNQLWSASTPSFVEPMSAQELAARKTQTNMVTPARLNLHLVTMLDLPDEAPPKSILAEKAVDCRVRPRVTELASQEWRRETHANNDFYVNSFTPVVTYKGNTYWVWVDTNYVPHVSKFGATEETVLLANGYKTKDNEHNVHFSLGIDAKGYLHISGDMQNGPDERKDDYPKELRGARIHYWKSKLPESITGGFEFVGNGARSIPANSVNGITFMTDNFGVLYAAAHVAASDIGHVTGERGVGLYRYNLRTGGWIALGGSAGLTPLEVKDKTSAKKYPVVFWDNGGAHSNGWFQGIFYRLRFDVNNRLHFVSAINTNTALEYNERLIYAVREGEVWKRADGGVIPALPIRAIDGTPSQGSLVRKDDAHPFHWAANVTADRAGRPAVWAQEAQGRHASHWFSWKGKAWVEGEVSITGSESDNAMIAAGGALIVTGRNSAAVTCYDNLTAPGTAHILEGYESFVNGDEYGLKTSGVLVGVAINKSKNRRALVKIDYTGTH